MISELQIGDILANYWLVENRYCGLPESQMLKRLNQLTCNPLPVAELHSRLLTLQAKGDIAIGGPEADPVIFPRRTLLEPRDPVKESKVGVYAKLLRLGGFQIEMRYFSRQVLDRYYQDPRYEFKEFAVSGRISTPSDVPTMSLKDIVHIRYGHAYHPNGTPAVVATLSDLGELPRGHQQHWASYEIDEECHPDSDFIRQNFDAQPVERLSPHHAILRELREINRICELAGEPDLFRETHESRKLSKLMLITKPTADEFGSFVSELDKLLSQNINKRFFKSKVDLVDSKGRDKGTLTLLDQFLQSYGLTSSDTGDTCESLRRVRHRRQVPAHEISEDEFDTGYWAQQNELITDVLGAVCLLREALEKHLSLRGRKYIP